MPTPSRGEVVIAWGIGSAGLLAVAGIVGVAVGNRSNTTTIEEPRTQGEFHDGVYSFALGSDNNPSFSFECDGTVLKATIKGAKNAEIDWKGDEVCADKELRNGEDMSTAIARAAIASYQRP